MKKIKLLLFFVMSIFVGFQAVASSEFVALDFNDVEYSQNQTIDGIAVDVDIVRHVSPYRSNKERIPSVIMLLDSLDNFTQKDEKPTNFAVMQNQNFDRMCS